MTELYDQRVYSLWVVHSMQQSRAGALLILTYAAIQVVYINTFHGMFVIC